MWPLDSDTIADLARQCRHFNAFPIFRPRYFYDRKPHPLGSALRSVVSDVEEYIAAMSDAEYATFLDALPAWTRFNLDRHPDRQLPDQRERIALWCVAGAIQEQYASSVASPRVGRDARHNV